MSDRDSVLHSPSDAPGLTGSASFTKGSPGVENSAGTLLRNARQAQGLDIDALAATLKVSTQKLQALEQDRFDLLLDPAFVRALASSVCRMLKLDPAPVLQRLPPITAFKMTSQNRGINTPFRPREAGPGSSLRMQFSRPAVLLGLALLLGALVLIFLPLIQQEVARYRAEGRGMATKSELLEPVSRATPGTSDILVATGASAASAASSSSAGEPQPPPATQAFMTSPAAAPSLLEPPIGAEAGANATVTFSAKNESWVKVTDAKGVVVLSRTLHTGESAAASGALPLMVAVGRADALQVQVRGQAFDLSAIAKNNVARFEVK